MSKKKEQVKILKKCFAAVIKAFEKEKDKRKRQEAFDFLTGRMTAFRQLGGDPDDKIPTENDAVTGAEAGRAGSVVPSPALVEEIRSEHRQHPG